MDNKQKVYDILFNNAVKLLLININLNFNRNTSIDSIDKLLCIASHQRYYIEYILNILYPDLDLKFNLDKFGRCRSKLDNHGRLYKGNLIKKELYSPFKFLFLNKDHESLITPIYIKYKHYDQKIKDLTVKYNGYTTNEPIFKLLYKMNKQSFTVIYNNIELTTFYYENDSRVLKELEEIPIKDRFLSKDINLYRAIYHTSTESHTHILNELSYLYNLILGDIDDKTNVIKKIYWLLSHATLYERGSAAITEMICSALFSTFNGKQIIKAKKGINLDIEAMISPTIDDFLLKWDKYTIFTDMNTNRYYSINLNDWKNKKVNNKFYTSNISSIEDIMNFLEDDSMDFNSLLTEL